MFEIIQDKCFLMLFFNRLHCRHFKLRKYCVLQIKYLSKEVINTEIKCFAALFFNRLQFSFFKVRKYITCVVKIKYLCIEVINITKIKCFVALFFNRLKYSLFTECHKYCFLKITYLRKEVINIIKVRKHSTCIVKCLVCAVFNYFPLELVYLMCATLMSRGCTQEIKKKKQELLNITDLISSICCAVIIFFRTAKTAQQIQLSILS